ncbi:MAG: hypothetical protein IJX85_06140 [Lachnospiraceae bacterium]|nr:hypothetical protein [Lachnospiraceae bacterium]
MGRIIRYRHKGCSFSYDFKEGAGFKDFSRTCDSRKQMRARQWGERWKALIEQYPDGTGVVERALCYCQECKEYCTESRKSFYIPKEGSKFEYDESDMVPPHLIGDYFEVLEEETILCPKCNKETKPMENLRKVPCGKCGQMSEWKVVGYWD